jgi:uncharacterized protein
MIHGASDPIVPYSLGKRLWEAAPAGQEFVSVQNAGHNNLQQTAGGMYEEALGRWLGS